MKTTAVMSSHDAGLSSPFIFNVPAVPIQSIRAMKSRGAIIVFSF
jgi:hypothetical protein